MTIYEIIINISSHLNSFQYHVFPINVLSYNLKYIIYNTMYIYINVPIIRNDYAIKNINRHNYAVIMD